MMAFIVRKGTRILVRKPSGEVVAYTCKRDCMFPTQEKVGEYKTLQFKKGEFVVSVPAVDVTEIRFKCPQCGVQMDIQGLCDTCRKQWLPKR